MKSETERVYCPICGGEAEMPVDTLEGLATGPDAIAQAMRDAPRGSAKDGRPRRSRRTSRIRKS